MKNVLVFLFSIAFFASTLHGQTKIAGESTSNSKTDSLEKLKKDNLSRENLKRPSLYPVIQAGSWSAVWPVKNISVVPDTTMQYKLVINLTYWDGDSASKTQISGGLNEICRLINLHVASGIPLKNLDVVVVAHAAALNTFLNDSAYSRKFRLANPNLRTIQQLAGLNTKFVACGQAEQYMNIKQDDLVPEIKTALTAQVMLSYYQMKGYALFLVENSK